MQTRFNFLMEHWLDLDLSLLETPACLVGLFWGLWCAKLSVWCTWYIRIESWHCLTRRGLMRMSVLPAQYPSIQSSP
jgi:hypothetical protein